MNLVLFQKIILPTFPEKVFPVHTNGQKQSEKLCHRYSEPGTVDSKKLRQDQQGDRGKDQRSRKGNDCGYSSVGQCGEKSGGKDIKPAEQKVYGKQPEAGDSQLIGFRIIREDGDNAGGKEDGCRSHKCGNDCSEPERNMVNFFQFLSVFSAVLESDHWADADGESQIKGLE